MMGRSHLLSGAAAGAWLGVAMTPNIAVALVGVGLGAAAAMTPDLDHPSARAVKRLGVVGIGLCLVIRFASKLTTGVEHRGLSHSFAFAGLLGWLTYFVASLAVPSQLAIYLGVSVATGVVSALLGDLITLNGLDHLMWPFGVRVSIPYWMRIKTNGPFERFIVFPLMVIATVAGIAQLGGVITAVMAGAGHG